jgi:hypothetical protein
MNPELFWGIDSSKCIDCPAERDGKSPRCADCRKKHRAKMLAAQKAEDRKYLPERICKCGCGVVFNSKRSHYASKECIENERERAKEAPRRVAATLQPPKPKTTPTVAMKRQWSPPKMQEPIGPTVNNGVTVTKVQSLMRPSLRNLFGDETGAQWLATDW